MKLLCFDHPFHKKSGNLSIGILATFVAGGVVYFEAESWRTIERNIHETFYSEELASIPCGLQNIDSDKKEVNLVISTQTDFDKYFPRMGQFHFSFHINVYLSSLN